MNKTLRQFLLIVFFLTSFLLWQNAEAATISVASYGDGTCSLANATLAYNAANVGDTILFPNESVCSWSSQLTIRKAVTLDGNGTILTADGSLTSGFFEITGFAASSLVRITNFNFDSVNYAANNMALSVHGMLGGVSVGNIRIDHNTFHYGYMVIAFTHGKGLVDNNYFYNALQGVMFSAGSRNNADESWESLTAGTEDALYIEDNHFITDAEYSKTYTQEQIGTFQGGKLVARHNDFDFDNMPDDIGTATPFMAHGSADGGCEGVGYWEYDADTTRCIRRGQSVMEFYDNTMHGKRIDFLYISRGSANLVYDNQVTSTVKYSPVVYFYEEEYFIWNTVRVNWPAEDQVHNSFIWNNTYMSNPITTVSTAPRNDSCTAAGTPMPCCTGNQTGTCLASDYIKQDRDYFLHAPCAASDTTDDYGNTCTHGKETFVCANGVTECNGASNTYPTDGNTYSTKGTMVFTATGDNAYLDYTPYTYPHPLRSSDDVVAPNAPSGLNVS